MGILFYDSQDAECRQGPKRSRQVYIPCPAGLWRIVRFAQMVDIAAHVPGPDNERRDHLVSTISTIS